MIDIDRAKRIFSALKKLGERECSPCHGYGFNHVMDRRTNCLKCSGTGKVRWKWEPKKWQMVIYNGKIDVITGHSGSPLHVHLSSKPGVSTKELIPIFHWETIEEILEGVGYWLEMNRPLSKYLKKNTMRVGCSIYQTGKLNYIVYAQAKSRQEAVENALLELVEERKNEDYN